MTDGEIEDDRLTVPTKPWRLVRVIVEFAPEPGDMEIDDWAAEIVKAISRIDATYVDQHEAPFGHVPVDAVWYSPATQTWVASVGSTPAPK